MVLSVNMMTHYKIDLKHAVTMPLHQEYSLACIYGCMKFYCLKVRDLLRPQKVMFHVTKT